MGFKKTAAGLIVALSAAFAATTGFAQDAQITPGQIQAPAASVPYTNRIFLAYVPGPSTIANNIAQQGLTALGTELANRTTIDPKGVVALNLEKDDLGIFPFIYWPVTSGTPTLSAVAQKKVQGYIDRGGIILFDVQDQALSLDSNSALRRMLGSVSLKPLSRLPEKHTLTRAFYLLSTLPGAGNDGNVLVEKNTADGREAISSVIIGDNNWAGAWSGLSVDRRSTEYQMAMRSGVNMVMYALMGNYKADQLQVDQILKRLGR